MNRTFTPEQLTKMYDLCAARWYAQGRKDAGQKIDIDEFLEAVTDRQPNDFRDIYDMIIIDQAREYDVERRNR